MRPSILGITPFERPDTTLAVALSRAAAIGVLDLGTDLEAARSALAAAARRASRGLGVRVHAGALPPPDSLPAAVEIVVLPSGIDPAPWRPRRVFVQVVSSAEAARAIEAGADALIAVGLESGGRVGDESAFILSQRLIHDTNLPVWVQGGIGPHSAAACFAGGAAGVVLDSQLALVRESTLPQAVKDVVRAMDGSETALCGGRRVLAGPLARRLGPGVPGSAGLPIGQDAAFARPLAERHETAAGVVAAIHRGAREGILQARELEPLAPDAPLARAHGTRYPILQGPMTRVSDRAPFAADVAAAGGLPFLALSLLHGEPLRALLAETAELLDGRPWGVGILGFVPPELRAKQLAVIEEARPPFALIAGGRPSQSRELERRGIPTYLHVPSGGLLDLFLREGARRFVFEGRECGGHVGPLSSFALWQTQIDRLLAFERPEELSVVFAGGIADARSAAMVAAMAAPLAARGAKIGVLMGTAYLFTEEAVATGAVVPAYQRTAIECQATSLLETGPGHATRCVDTEYTREFRAERQRLEEAGLDPREVWGRLERMNLGRLRMASRGLHREGDELLPIDEPTQRREGMYMIGQVAALRDSVSTIEALHRDVSEGSLRHFEAAAPAIDPGDTADSPAAGPGEKPPRPADVAIIGMAAIFPMAGDLDEYWANIVEGVDAITEVPRGRWDPAVYYDPDGAPGRTTPSKWGGFIGDVVFDPASYGIPPKSLAAIDPIQLLSLEVARRALEDAGYGGLDRASRPFDRDRTGVVFGAEGGTDLSKAYGFRAMYPQVAGPLPQALDDHLPVPTEDSFPGVLTNVISGRIANRLDLGGENYTVNAACASSLAALSVAAGWLAAGSCDMALVGGADVHNSIGDYLMFSSVHALSRSGRCRTFDRDADGITLGEGVGAVVVKRLADAERDGDRIYAVVKGIAGSSDGKSLGLTAPRLEGQEKALRWAYRAAGISPAEVGLMEAHGTGTVVGDCTELQSMERIFAEAGARPGTCALSSVKSQIGHTKAAAGIASLIKVALCLHQRVLPPTLHVEEPNPNYDAARSPFTLSERSRPWVAGSGGIGERVASVSAFGFGGTNYHAVLAEHEGIAGASAPRAVWPAEIFLFRGIDRETALARTELLRQALAARPEWTLRDLARSTARGGSGPFRIAFVARDRAELALKLDRARAAGGEAPASEDDVPDADRIFVAPEGAGGDPGRVAFLFPGQGSQYVGMMSDLFVTFPALGDILASAPGVADRMFPPRAFTPRGRAVLEAALTATEVAQVAIGMCDAAMARLLAGLGVRPDALAGHSYGEMVALCEAGAWDVPTLLDLSAARARVILDAAGEDPGTMAAVQAGAAQIEPLVADLDRIALANHNAPRQTILSGTTVAIEAAIGRLEAAGLRVSRLNVACAFHSPVVAGARGAFRSVLSATDVRPLQRTVWSNATARPYEAEPDSVRELLAEQLARPVLFAPQIEAMYEAGTRVFIEVGPGRVLTGLVDRTLGDRPHVAVATDVRGEPGLARLMASLARLAVAGVEFDADALFAGRGATLFDLEAPPERALPGTAWIVNGHYARPAEGPLPAGAYHPAALPVVPSIPPDFPLSAEEAIVAYLRNVRELAEAQRQVMLSWLGAPASFGPAVPGVPAATAAPAATRETAEGTGVEAAARAAPRPRRVGEVLLEIVGERTGYPLEMLDLDLDLEADLSIDSIKRMEILGALDVAIGLADRLGDHRDELVEELAAIRTLRGIEAWIEQRSGPGRPPEEPSGTPPVDEPAARGLPPAEDDGATAAEPLSRFRFELRPLAPATVNGTGLAGRTFVLTDDGGGVAAALAVRLEAAGATVRFAEEDERMDGADGLVHLAPLSPLSGPADVKALYRLCRSLVAAGGTTIVGVTGMGGGFGYEANGASRAGQGGVAGFLKSLAKEWSGVRVRAVDLDPAEETSVLAEHVWQEILCGDDRIEVGYAAGQRRGLAVVSAPLPPAGEGEPILDARAVVLVTGGARGITAHLSIALARLYGCRLELVGRSPLPEESEPREMAEIQDPLELKRRLIALHPGAQPAEIEDLWRALRAEREIRRTLEEIRAAGSAARYHAIDVRDEVAFGGLIDGVYSLHGRIDGVVHGAGLIEDGLLVHKTPESFDRVFDTKVAGALTLARKLRNDTRFVVFFASVVGAFGNRGQTDYAAANDVLDKLALHLNVRLPGRIVSVDWGPWDSAGMVTPELRREYARRGIGLISAGAGVASLLDEIASGDRDAAQVVLTRGRPDR